MNKFFSSLVLISFLMGFLIKEANAFPSGANIGISSGWEHNSTDVKKLRINADSGGIIEPNEVASSISQNINAAVVNGILGYLHHFSSTFVTLGARFVFGYSSAERSFDQHFGPDVNLMSFSINGRLKSKFQYAFDAILGAVLMDCYHLYLVGGIGQDCFDTHTSVAISNAGGGNEFTTHSNSKSFRRTNYRFGVGAEKKLSENIRFGIEGVWSFFNKDINLRQDGVGVPSVDPGGSVEYKYPLCKFQLLAVMTYNFWSPN